MNPLNVLPQKEKGVSTIIAVLISAIVVAVVVGSITYFLARPTEPEEKIKIGYLPYFQRFDYHVTKRDLAGLTAMALDADFMWNDSDGDPVKQKTQAKYMIDAGCDAIVYNPNSTGVGIAELCRQHGVIPITVDVDEDSPDVSLSIHFGMKEAAKSITEEVVDFLTTKYGEPKGLVFNIQDDLKGLGGQLRNMGFHDVMDDYPEIETVDIVTDAEADKAFTNTKLALESKGKPDAIFGAMGALTVAGVEALETKDMAIPSGEEGHVFVGTIDAFPPVLEKMGEGLIDCGFSQPMPFYAGLGVYIAYQAVVQGEEEIIPEIGTTLTGEDYRLDELGVSYKGTNPFAQPFWAPASVVEDMGHPWVVTAGLIVTANNMNSDLLWSNWG